MLKLKLAAIVIALFATTSASAVDVNPMTVDPCVFGYAIDQTVFADGTPAPALPC